MNIKSILRKTAYGYKAESSSYIEHLRSIGMKIGSDCIIYVPTKTLIDEQYPWMITIGNHVRITEGVKILTHDYAWSVLKTEKGAILGASGTVKIGDNVFIGMNTVITRNVEIGNNVIIGAGSLVNHDIPDNCVAAGNPCRVIMNLEDYYKKRVSLQYEEAKEMVQKYRERYGKEIDDYSLREHFWLFSGKNTRLHDEWKQVMTLVGNEDECYQVLQRRNPYYRTKEEFLNSIK